VAGFFDTSGMDADPYSGTTNNAAADYARLSSNNPSWFGGRKKKEVQKEALDTSASMPTTPAASTPDNPTGVASKPAPALTSAPGLVTSVLQQIASPPTYNAQGQSLVPGTPFTPQEFAQTLVQEVVPPLMNMLAPNLQAQPSDIRNPQLAPFQGVPQFTGPQPPAREQQSPFGNQRFGGNTFGGNRFGGRQFGASASPPMASPQARPAASAGQRPGGPMSEPNPIEGPYAGETGDMTPMPTNPTQQLLALLKARQQPNSPPSPGFYRGGTLQLARGGYPELMGGMPMRQHAKGGVPADGRGDGRSDHVQALLSPGEFVQDAETVSLLGNGDSDAGARGMEAIRQTIRREKGKALAKGKFSPNAKSPGHYAKVGMRAAQKGAK
jgi:hypothetical protein